MNLTNILHAYLGASCVRYEVAVIKPVAKSTVWIATHDGKFMIAQALWHLWQTRPYSLLCGTSPLQTPCCNILIPVSRYRREQFISYRLSFNQHGLSNTPDYTLIVVDMIAS